MAALESPTVRAQRMRLLAMQQRPASTPPSGLGGGAGHTSAGLGGEPDYLRRGSSGTSSPMGTGQTEMISDFTHTRAEYLERLHARRLANSEELWRVFYDRSALITCMDGLMGFFIGAVGHKVAYEHFIPVYERQRALDDREGMLWLLLAAIAYDRLSPVSVHAYYASEVDGPISAQHADPWAFGYAVQHVLVPHFGDIMKNSDPPLSVTGRRMELISDTVGAFLATYERARRPRFTDSAVADPDFGLGEEDTRGAGSARRG